MFHKQMTDRQSKYQIASPATIYIPKGPFNLIHSNIGSDLKVWCLTLQTSKVLDIDIGVGRGIFCHVRPIQHHWNHIVVKHLPELLCQVIFTEGVLQGEVELRKIV